MDILDDLFSLALFVDFNLMFNVCLSGSLNAWLTKIFGKSTPSRVGASNFSKLGFLNKFDHAPDFPTSAIIANAAHCPLGHFSSKLNQ